MINIVTFVMTPLRDALKLSGGGIISLVGAGGKTSLMGALADELSRAGHAVLITTTTRIARPADDQVQAMVVEENPQQLLPRCREAVKVHPIVTAVAGYYKTRDKLAGFLPETVEAVWHSGIFKWIVVEADGAARKPIKAPASHEPVIPQLSRWVIGLIGLLGIGKPFTDQWVFRPEHFQKITGLREGDTVSASAIASILSDSRGVLKGAPAGARKMVFLNQADAAEQIAEARQIISFLRADPLGLERVVIGRLKPTPQVIDCIDLDG